MEAGEAVNLVVACIACTEVILVAVLCVAGYLLHAIDERRRARRGRSR
jgi:hypothetical protein